MSTVDGQWSTSTQLINITGSTVSVTSTQRGVLWTSTVDEKSWYNGDEGVERCSHQEYMKNLRNIYTQFGVLIAAKDVEH